MKKQLLLFFSFLLLSSGLFASHMMGGQITSKNIGGLTYEVTVTIYRDTLGVPIFPTGEIHYLDAAGAEFVSHIVMVSPAVIFGNGVETYYYVDTITFPNAGDFSMWYTDCCRNAAIINMTNPGGESFFLYNDLLVDPGNSSPVFLNEPITLAQINTPFNYNPLPFDADGDSLDWTLDVPQSFMTLGTSMDVVGYTLPATDPLVPFTINSATGEITFLPNTLGYFAVSLLIKEYRAGVLIGEIRRDMQIIVVNSGNRSANISLNSNTAPFSGKNYTMDPGTPFSFTVVANDPDGIPVSFSASGEPFLMANNPAVFTSSVSGNTTTATLSWTPNSSQQRSQPYIIGLRKLEAFAGLNFFNDITIKLHVDAATGLNEQNNKSTFVINPNPANDFINVNFVSKNRSDVKLEISNLAGQTVKSYEGLKSIAGNNTLLIKDLNLTTGVYIVRLIQDASIIGTSKLNIR